jgi:predicted transcriptional regulator
MAVKLKLLILNLMHENGGWMRTSQVISQMHLHSNFRTSSIKCAISELCAAELVEKQKILGGDSETKERMEFMITEKGLLEIGRYKRPLSILQLPTPWQLEAQMKKSA